MTSTSPSDFPTDVSEDKRRHFLSKLQAQTTEIFIPTLILLAVVAVVGLIGNSIVLVVYFRKVRRNATDILIMAIAVTDLLINVVAIPNEVYDILHLWDFHDVPLCRFRGFFNAFTTMTSAIALLAIAVVRFRKICRPFGKPVTLKMVKILAVIIPIVCCGFASPYLILYGIQVKETKNENISGKECFIDDKYSNTIWPKLYLGFLFVLFLAAFVPLIILNVLIGLQALKHSKLYGISITSTAYTQSDGTFSDTFDSDDRKYKIRLADNLSKKESKIKVMTDNGAMTNRSSHGEEPKSAVGPVQKYKEEKDDHNVTTGQFPVPALEVFDDIRLPRKACKVTIKETNDEETKLQSRPHDGNNLNIDDTKPKASCQRKDRNRGILSRTTLMLITISLVYVIVYLPYLILALLKFVSDSFYDDMNDVGESVYNVFLRFFFINSAANAIIYSLWDIRFRKEVFNILRWNKRT